MPSPSPTDAVKFPVLGVVGVAVLFLAILIAIVAPVIGDKVREGQLDRARLELRQLSQELQQTPAPRASDESFNLDQRDPWGGRLRAYHFAHGPVAMMILSAGPDGERDSTTADLRAGAPRGDDLLQAVPLGVTLRP